MNFPFEQEIRDNKIRRTFNPDVDSEELKWHQDLKNRKITIVDDGGWLFQSENELPRNLKTNETFTIQKSSWHRVIKGTNTLIIEIEEFD